MKGFLITVGVLFALMLTGVVTCPDKEQHVNALSELANNIIDNNVDTDITDNILVAFLRPGVVNAFIENSVTIENFFVYSVARFEWQGESKVVSVGAFNHIFTMDEEDIQAHIDEMTGNDHKEEETETEL